jgi:hypothetical protein
MCKEPFNGQDYTSVRMHTRGKGDWAYGRVEVRVARATTGSVVVVVLPFVASQLTPAPRFARGLREAAAARARPLAGDLAAAVQVGLRQLAELGRNRRARGVSRLRLLAKATTIVAAVGDESAAANDK